MAALFPRWTNAPFAIAIGAIGAVVVLAICAPMIWIRTPYASGRNDAPLQPVQFDHRHHVRDDGVDCLYCHPGAETGANAGVPPTELCMGCHGQVWQNSPKLALVRESWETGTAIPWVRVNDVPDHVYFHHAVHVRTGIPCVSCHGEVDNMARVRRAQDLSMRFCLECHRWPPEHPQSGRHITPLTTCTACHR